MAEILEKLRPDRDLQCYFERPSAIAALSEASATGFTVSGCWRQQFDWAVVEWNRDNVFEHPTLRNLPDGDLSGLELTYDETRENCVPIDSDLYWTVEWPFLRIWPEGSAQPRLVRVRDYAEAIEGSYQAATAELELSGTITAGDYIGLAWLGEQYNYAVTGSDTLETAAAALAGAINSFSSSATAAVTGARITLTCTTPGANWNRVGVYGFVSGARTEHWAPWWAQFSGGLSPSKWRVHLEFDNLRDTAGALIPTSAVRKMRWTWAADLQAGAYDRSEFRVQVSNWTVTGANRGYLVAGPGSLRIEDTEASYTGSWTVGKGNYSGGTIHSTQVSGATATCTYRATATHKLYLGTRLAADAGAVSVSIDSQPAQQKALTLPDDAALARLLLGTIGPGSHTVKMEYAGPADRSFHFDFLEIAIPRAELPEAAAETKLTLATDWDTDHSICLAPERTAWMIAKLGFYGRQNNYVGALWFYELVRQGHQYASGSVQFSGTPTFGENTQITIGREGQPSASITLTHAHYIGDTAETVAKAFELEMNRGYTAFRAEASGALLTIYSRTMGADGNAITVASSTTDTAFQATANGPKLAGGADGDWFTDLAATPRVNRAARDWNRGLFAALHSYGIDAAAAFSMELRHGDPSVEAGIAQRRPGGEAVILNTPALQTNFSPTSIAFWKQVYLDMAQAMQEAGIRPYLQFGEVQWWYFRDNGSGMPFYDAYTQSAFQAQYGRPMGVIVDNTAPVSQYPDEAAFLPTLIGAFTTEVMQYVRQTFADCRFEVLYPLDVNDTELNQAVNFPAAVWTASALDCLKTESFGYTYGRDLNKCQASIDFPQNRDFLPHQSAHLIGVSDPSIPWVKEVTLSMAGGVESVVLFALDQYCLIGPPSAVKESGGRSGFQG